VPPSSCAMTALQVSSTKGRGSIHLGFGGRLCVWVMRQMMIGDRRLSIGELT
jgi:hypothetical protein